MTARIAKQGNYELFRDTQGTQILQLDGEQLRLTQGPRNEVMAGRHGEFDRQQTLDKGEYKLIEFDEENGEDDRLLLQRRGDFRVVLLPEGIPQGPDDEVRARLSEEVVGVDELETYVAALRSGGAEGRDRLDGSDVATAIGHHLQSIDFPAEKTTLIDYAHRRQAAGEVIEVLQRLDDDNYQSLNELQDAAADMERIDRLGIDEQSTEELIEMIEAMEPAELYEFKKIEQRRSGRSEVIDAIERQLQKGT